MGGQSLAFQERAQAEEQLGLGSEGQWNPAFPRLCRDYALLGASDADIASLLGVHEQTFLQWKRDKPDLIKNLAIGREGADVRVAKSAFRRAVGYTLNDVRVKRDATGQVVETIEQKRHIPASDAMIAMWLERRQPGRWGDKRLGEVGSAAADLVELIKAAAVRGEAAKVIEATPIKDDADTDPP